MIILAKSFFLFFLFNSTLYLVYLLFDTLYKIMKSFSFYLFVLQYESFLVTGFTNELVRNLSTVRLIVSNSANQWAHT